MAGNPYHITDLVLQANIPREIRVDTRFLALVSATVSLITVEISLGDSDSWQPLVFGVTITELDNIKRVGIRSSSAQTVRLALGSAMVTDSRAAPSGGTVSMSIVDVGGLGLGQELSAASVPVVIASDQVVPVKGQVADGAAVGAAVPVLIAGQDGANVQSLKVDTTGRAEVVGQVADGAAVAGAGAPVLIAGQDGANVQTLKTNTTGQAEVVGAVAAGSAIGTTAPVLMGISDATNVQRLKGSATGAVMVTGEAAHSAASVGSPVRVGGRVATAVDTTLVAGDAADLQADSSGAIVVTPYGIPEGSWQYAAAAGGIVNSAVAVAMKAAAAAGIRNYCTGFDWNTDALTTASELAILDGATVIWRTKLQLGVQRGSVTFPKPLRGTAATALNVQTLTATGAGVGVFVNAQGFTAP